MTQGGKEMNRLTITILLIVSTVLFLGLVTTCSIISFNNSCVSQEQGIIAQYNQNRNNYDNYFKKLKEAAQVPDMYTEDLLKLYDKAMTGRYGEEGSKAIFQWLSEQNPNLDASIYKKIQDIIEAGRNSFEADQKMLIDKKRAYITYISIFPNNIFAKLLGFPKIDLAKYDIVTSEETEKTFKDKKSNPIDLR
jgi:hypothetical protein